MTSPIVTALDALAAALPPDQAALELQAILDTLTAAELAALLYDWRGTWARPKQLLPTDNKWRSCGLLTGRGFGKTRAISEWFQNEVQAGRCMRIACIAQNEAKTLEVMIDGKSGLIATSPPWFKAKHEKGHLVWPNGAQAFPYTPEAPGALRGPEHDAAWVSEPVVWPASQRDEAFSNLRLTLRLGYGRMVWDSTPKRRHPLIRYLLERSKKWPQRHRVVRGSTYENRDNLTPEAIEEWEDAYGGTQKGREELHGEFLDDSDGALWKAGWIDDHRRQMPSPLKRRIICIDPAISTRKGTDCTGIADLGLGTDDQAYVIADYSGKHSWTDWGSLVVGLYLDNRCDCIVEERNRGGDAVVANLRSCAKERGLAVVVVGEKAVTRHQPGTIFVKDIFARRGKESRAEPVATAYEKGRVSHVIGADLEDLEDVMLTWEPTPYSKKSPDGMDAMVHGVWELLNLAASTIDHRAGFKGLEAIAKELTRTTAHNPAQVGVSIADAMRRGGGSDKI